MQGDVLANFLAPKAECKDCNRVVRCIQQCEEPLKIALGRNHELSIVSSQPLDCVRVLAADGNNIIQYVGRDREYSHGKDGGKVKVSKIEFLTWLLSEAPFDERVYGATIREDADWVQRIESARTASGLFSDESTPIERGLL